jgi:hypothetical protein
MPGVGRSRLLAACAADWRTERIAVLGTTAFLQPVTVGGRSSDGESLLCLHAQIMLR